MSKKGKIQFIVIPDFTSCLSHGKSTRNNLIAILRSMTEEGVTDLTKRLVEHGFIGIAEYERLHYFDFFSI